MTDATIYNLEGKKSGTIALPAGIFGVKWNADLVHQVVTSMLANARQPIADTKGRGEVSGGGKKPWKQKGTGRSRHGSIRSPIWRGGGITHGPTSERVFDRKINRAMRAKALYTVLSRKLKDGEMVFVDSLVTKEAKTKFGAEALAKLATAADAPSLAWKKGKRALLVLAEKNDAVKKSFRNIPSVGIEEARNINPVEVLEYSYIVVERPEESFKTFEARVQ